MGDDWTPYQSDSDRLDAEIRQLGWVFLLIILAVLSACCGLSFIFNQIFYQGA